MSQSTELKVKIGEDTFYYWCGSRVLGAAFTAQLHETFALDNEAAYDALTSRKEEWIGGVGLRSYAYLCDMASDVRESEMAYNSGASSREQWLLIEITRRD